MPLYRSRPSGWLLVLSLGLMMILVACNGSTKLPVESESGAGTWEEAVIQPSVQEEGPSEPKILDSNQEEIQPEQQITPTELSVEDPTSEANAPLEEPTPEPEPEEAAAPPQEKLFVASERPLESTDPTGVNLSSGQYHLVEFFAYW